MRRWEPGIVAGVAFVAMLGCSHVAGQQHVAPSQSSGDTTARGVVRVVGAEPLTQVVLRPGDAGAGVGILGLLRAEIGSLDGVEMTVTGPAVPNSPPPPARAVDAKRYDILAVGGVPAHVGVLARRGDAYVLLGALDTLELLSPVPPSVAALTGARVFIVGVVGEGRLHVQSYGRIAHP